jgi:hypothetical protein
MNLFLENKKNHHLAKLNQIKILIIQVVIYLQIVHAKVMLLQTSSKHHLRNSFYRIKVQLIQIENQYVTTIIMVMWINHLIMEHLRQFKRNILVKLIMRIKRTNKHSKELMYKDKILMRMYSKLRISNKRRKSHHKR